MAYHRRELQKKGIRSAIELHNLPDGAPVRIAGSVIARQRPGTAKGFVFLSLEDETGIANAIITPQLFEHEPCRDRAPAIFSDRRKVAESGERRLGQSRIRPSAEHHPRGNDFARFPLRSVRSNFRQFRNRYRELYTPRLCTPLATDTTALTACGNHHVFRRPRHGGYSSFGGLQ